MKRGRIDGGPSNYFCLQCSIGHAGTPVSPSSASERRNSGAARERGAEAAVVKDCLTTEVPAKRVAVPTEHEEQAAYFEWAEAKLTEIPYLKMAFAIPNGASVPYKRIGKGKSYAPLRLKLLVEGLKPGIPDVFLAVPSLGWAGLFLEFKRVKYSPSDVSQAQKDWHTELRASGYAVEVVAGWREAANATLEYLGYEWSI